MLDPDFTQIAAGGVLALLIIREVLGFLRKKLTNGNGGSTGEKPVEFWREQIRSLAKEIIKEEVDDLIERQKKIWDAINHMRTMQRGNSWARREDKEG